MAALVGNARRVAFRTKDALGSIARWHAANSRRAPVLTGFATCFTAGCCADTAIQSLNGSQLDYKRSLKFAIFTGCYGGVACHYIYVVAFGKLLGEGSGAATVLAKVALDQFVHCPFIYAPVFYIYHSLANAGTVAEGMERWRNEGMDMMKACWGLYIPFQLANFSVVPRDSRIAALCVCNGIWMLMLACFSQKQR
mmetsp:Transcript_75590/g.173025  ORF Transcript_75590/g.173025 Transcript_75590/m.173025 type:complete len:196 (+) Transcript_75590:88-675(+)